MHTSVKDQPEQAKRKLALIQALRGFAALCVVLTHAMLESGWRVADHGVTHYPSLGEVGVDIFFVISGFIMVVVAAGEFGRNGAPLTFLKKRIIRIVPLYWIMSAILVGVILLFPTLVEHPVLDWRYWIKSLFFIPAEHPIEGGLRPLLVVGWTLQYEMLFYALFAFGLLLPRAIGLGVVLSLLTILVAYGLVFEPSGAILRFYVNPIMLEFAAGIGIGWLYIRNFRLPAVFIYAMPLAGIVVMAAAWWLAFSIELSRVVNFGIPAALVVAGFVLPRGCETTEAGRLWRALGDGSYAIYLSHLFVLAALAAVLDVSIITEWRHHPYSRWLFVPAGLALSAFSGWLVYEKIEKPVSRFLRRTGSGVRRGHTASAPVLHR